MKYSKIYGEGQIFAYSGLEGESLYKNDFVGTLIKDKIGIKFYTKTPVILFNNHNPNEATFNVVSSDYIDYEYHNKKYIFVYLKSHVIIGLSDSINIESKNKNTIKNGVIFQKLNGKIAALYKNNSKFIFVYANTKKEASMLINQNINFDLEDVISSKKSFLESKIKNKFNNEELACKALSVMKSQIHSKEGKMQKHWSTPDRLPHKKMWLWDSVYHAIGFSNIDVTLAKELLEAIFYHQKKNGFIPHMMTPIKGSKITQPPIIMYGALKVFEKDKDIEFLSRVYTHNKAFLNWVHNNRRYSDLYLYSWNVTKKKTCRCDESGMDNSPRFDTKDKLYAIDFSCFMANEARLMKEVASLLNLSDDIAYFDSLFNKISKDINDILYSKEKKFYFDFSINKNKHHEVYSVCSFLPLFAKVVPEKEVKNLIKYLTDESYFKTKFMIPTIAKKDPYFSSDMWRGPVWINYNYMIIDGLLNYGLTDLANDIKKQTVNKINEIYLKTGVIFEFYDSTDSVLPMKLDRKGTPVEPYDFKIKMQTIRDYGWSTTLLLDMLHK